MPNYLKAMKYVSVKNESVYYLLSNYTENIAVLQILIIKKRKTYICFLNHRH